MKNINILKEGDIDLLYQLAPGEKPAFGIMTPQHMVEHLLLILQASNGTSKLELAVPKEMAEKTKQVLVYSDFQIREGIKSPLLPEDKTIDLVYDGLETSIKTLKENLKKFTRYFEENPEAEPINPILGNLTYEEWKIFHNKHFAHHFRQFRLI